MPKRLRQLLVTLLLAATTASCAVPGGSPFADLLAGTGESPSAAPNDRPPPPPCPPKPVEMWFTFAVETSEDDRAIIKEAAKFARDHFPLLYKRGPKYDEATNAWQCFPKKNRQRVTTTVAPASRGQAGAYYPGFIRLYTDPSWWPYAERNFKYRLVLHEAYHMYQDLSTLIHGQTQSRRRLRWLVEGSALWHEYDASVRLGEYPSMDAARAAETSFLRNSRSDLKDFERYRSGDVFDTYPLFFLATDELLRNHGGPKALRRYWEYAGEDDDWWVVFEAVFGLKANAFYKEFAGG